MFSGEKFVLSYPSIIYEILSELTACEELLKWNVHCGFTYPKTLHYCWMSQWIALNDPVHSIIYSLSRYHIWCYRTSWNNNLSLNDVRSHCRTRFENAWIQIRLQIERSDLSFQRAIVENRFGIIKTTIPNITVLH